MKRRQFLKGLALSGLSAIIPIGLTLEKFEYKRDEALKHWAEKTNAEIVNDIKEATAAIRSESSGCHGSMVVRMPKSMLEKIKYTKFNDEPKDTIMEFLTT